MVVRKSQLARFVSDVCKSIQAARADLLADDTPIKTAVVKVGFQLRLIDDTEAPIPVEATENSQPEQVTTQTREAAEGVQVQEGFISESVQVQDAHEDRTEQTYGRSSRTENTFVS